MVLVSKYWSGLVVWWYQKMKPFQFHLIWRLLNTFHISEIPNKVRSIIWTNVLCMSFDYKSNQPDRILSQKCWRQKALIEVSTRLSWFPASVLSSPFQTIQKTESHRKWIPFPKSHFFILHNLEHFIAHQKDIPLFRFSFLFRCVKVNLTFSKAISICTADASNLKQEAAAQFFNPSFWEIVSSAKLS